jgi:hypothetical protein
VEVVFATTVAPWTIQQCDLTGNKVSIMGRNAAQVRVQLQKQEVTATWTLEKHLEDNGDGPFAAEHFKCG